MKTRSLVAALALSLAVPAAAQAQPAVPAVQDGDMGCMIATGMIAMMAENLANKPGTKPEDRTEALKLYEQAMNANNFFLGRMSLQPAETTSAANYKAAYARYTALKQDDQIKMIQTCMGYAKDTKLGIIRSWDK